MSDDQTPIPHTPPDKYQSVTWWIAREWAIKNHQAFMAKQGVPEDHVIHHFTRPREYDAPDVCPVCGDLGCRPWRTDEERAAILRELGVTDE